MNVGPMKRFMPEYLFLNDKEVIEKIMSTFNLDEMEAAKEFLTSKTYHICADINNAMWDIGSNDIFNMWVVERVTGNPRNVNFMRLEN
jgi:hypothetical protein